MSQVQIIIRLDGHEYRTAPTDETDEINAETISDQIYSTASDVDRLRLTLVGGDWLVLPKDAVRRATFIVASLR